MQTSGVTARSCITDLTASNASDGVKPGVRAAFRSNDFHRRLRAGAQALDLAVVDRLDPALACVWHGEEFRPRVERPDVARQADVPDMDPGSGESALGERQKHALSVGRVR